MRIDDRERRVFLPQMRKNGDESDVFDHIGVIPRMEDVAVVHARMMNNFGNQSILLRQEKVMRPANWPRLATTIALSAGATLALIVSWPGHLSYDSIIQIHDGQTGFYHSWHPPVMAWLLGLLNTLLPGGALFVVLDVVIFFGALISLLWIKPQTSWAAFAFGILLLLLPQVWLYQTIVWKDVLFANASVAGFTGLIWTETRWNGAGAPRILLTASFAALVLATLTRQNGIIVLISGAACLGLMAFRRAGLRAAIAYCAIALAASTCVVLAVSAALALRSDDGEGPRLQLRLLHLYDLTGAVAREPSLPLEKLDANAPKLARLIRGDGARLYTPERNDTLVAHRRCRTRSPLHRRACCPRNGRISFSVTPGFISECAHRLLNGFC
ncbi:MAG: hypothetical protein WDM89_11970 [Rhizomicrobium sp.]